MLEQQRRALVSGVASLVNNGDATYGALEHQRTLYGATREDLVELLHDLDTRVATEYEQGPRPVRGSFTPREVTQ